jgi:peptidoglycan/xylan/chitin deacetylase (PgdA/CDA1 family)
VRAFLLLLEQNTTLVRTPDFIRRISDAVDWGDYQQSVKQVYLTFDDGPIPEVTPWVLDLLAAYNAKATFFCLGKHVNNYPTLYQRILNEGHKTGNHTWDHADGWKTEARQYYRSVIKAESVIKTDLFRPPYGRITPRQLRALRKRYTIVLWSVLSEDYDRKQTPEQCIVNITGKVRAGDILVFHDSIKAQPNLVGCLEPVLHYLKANGFKFSTL